MAQWAGTNIMALQQRKATLVASAKAMLDRAKQEGRDLSGGESANFQKTRLALDALEKEITAEQTRLAVLDSGEPVPDENMAFAALARGETPMTNPSAPKRTRLGQIGVKSYAELFGAPRGNGGYRSFEDFTRSVRMTASGSFDPRLQMSSTEGEPSQAGFLVPEQWAAMVLNYALESSIVMSRAQMFPMSNEILKVPGTKDDDHSAGSLYGGIKEFWADELQEIDVVDMQTRLVQLSVHRLALLSNASSELAEDSPSFESLLTANLQAAASFFLDQNFLFGNGVGRPLGMFDPGNKALVVVSKNSKTPTAGFLWEDAVAMYTAHSPMSRSRAIWIFSNDLLPALSIMQISVKNVAGTENVGGSATPMFTLNADGTGTLLGRPAIFTEKMKTAGTQGDAGFVCCDQYAVGMRREMQLRRSIDAGFTNDSIWWRLTTRVDGQPLWEHSQKLANGQVTSPFVTLAVRT